MQHCTRHVVHLVELVDTADAVIAQHQRARLQTQFARLGVARHAPGQTGGGGGASGGVHGAWRDGVDVLEELGLGGGGVADDADVDVAANGAAVGSVFVDAADELEENAALDVNLGA